MLPSDATTLHQDHQFAEFMKPEPPKVDLEKAIKWINDYLRLEQVFSQDMLNEWANENGWVKSELD